MIIVAAVPVSVSVANFKVKETLNNSVIQESFQQLSYSKLLFKMYALYYTDVYSVK